MRQRIYDLITVERLRQEAKFPGQRVPVLPPGYDLLHTVFPPEGVAKMHCDLATSQGRLTHGHIIGEEFCEFLDARTPKDIEEELIQLAACCVKALEEIAQRREEGTW